MVLKGTSPPANKFDLLPLYLEEPKDNPTTEQVTARPVEFQDDVPTAYVTTDPQNGQLVQLTADELVKHNDNTFYWVDPKADEVFIDPFQNPIESGEISTYALRPNVEGYAGEVPSDDKTLLERLQDE